MHRSGAWPPRPVLAPGIAAGHGGGLPSAGGLHLDDRGFGGGQGLRPSDP